MSDQFVGEIRIFACNFAPSGWALCNGQLLQISQNTALFSLLGTQFGGDGKTTFALPNLQNRAPLGMGSGPALTPRNMGDTGGETAVTLATNQLPQHAHDLNCVSGAGDQNSPASHTWATARVSRNAVSMYGSSVGSGHAMNAAALQPVGGSQSHNNMPPYLVLNFCIALQGIYPPRG
jgi:microcystin-dependent protein